MPPQTRRQRIQAALASAPVPPSLSAMPPNQDDRRTVEDTTHQPDGHGDHISVAVSILPALDALITTQEVDVHQAGILPAGQLCAEDQGDGSQDSSLLSEDDGNGLEMDRALTPEESVQEEDEPHSSSGNNEISEAQAGTQAFIEFLDLWALSIPGAIADPGTTENSSSTHEGDVQIPQHEGIVATPESDLDDVLAHAATVTTMDAALPAAAAIYYAAVHVAFTKAKRGDPPGPIAVLIPDVLAQACRGPERAQIAGPRNSVAIPTLFGPARSAPDQRQGSPCIQSIINCVFQTATDVTELTVKVSIRSPRAYHIIDALGAFSLTDEQFHREWRYLIESPSSYLLFTFDTLPTPHQQLIAGNGIALGRMDAIHERHGAILIPIMGQDAVALTERLGCGRYCELEGEELNSEMEYVWLPEADVFCLVIQKINGTPLPMRTEIASPLPDPSASTRPIQTSFHQHLSETYPSASLRLSELYDSQGTLTTPFFVRRFFQIIDPIAHLEGLMLSDLKDLDTFVPLTSGDTSPPTWEALLHWAEKKGEHAQLEHWRQRRAKVVLEAHYGTWVHAHIVLLEGVQSYRPLNPITGRPMQDLEPVSQILTVLDAFEHSTHLKKPIGLNTPTDELCAIGLKWSDLERMRRAMKQLAPHAKLYEVMVVNTEVMDMNTAPVGINVPQFTLGIQEIVRVCYDICQSLSWV